MRQPVGAAAFSPRPVAASRVRRPSGLFHPVSQALVAFAGGDDGDRESQRFDASRQISSQPLRHPRGQCRDHDLVEVVSGDRLADRPEGIVLAGQALHRAAGRTLRHGQRKLQRPIGISRFRRVGNQEPEAARPLARNSLDVVQQPRCRRCAICDDQNSPDWCRRNVSLLSGTRSGLNRSLPPTAVTSRHSAVSACRSSR
jgi:hypothetical protein